MYYILRLDVANAASGLTVQLVDKATSRRQAVGIADRLTRMNPSYTHMVVIPEYSTSNSITPHSVTA